TPYADLIERWHLQKKDPALELSEPVEPIVFWIENTTPFEFRDIVRDAVLRWNIAFEAAGIKNAIVVKTQPDDADWDAGDIRYNVIRWASSPDPFFAGYGPAFVDPRTGQILGGDIELEFIFVTNRLAREKLFETAALEDIFPALLLGGERRAASGPGHHHWCSAGDFIRLGARYGLQALKTRGASEEETSRLLEESLFYLTMHEVGHVLGLSHNMMASQLHSPKDIHNRKLTERVGLISSVMDYPPVNIAPRGTEQGSYYTTRPGPFDIWSIRYGYSQFEAEAEETALDDILAESADPVLAFGNDADDMRYSGQGIDPRIMVGDMSSDSLAYAVDRIETVKALEPELLEKYVVDGQSYEELRDAFMLSTRERANALRAVSRHIGGIEINRAQPQQEGASTPYQPVERERQRQAMATLEEHLFAPNAFDYDSALIAHMQPQRRGFEFSFTTEDPKVHARVLNIQTGILGHLLHPKVLARLTDSGLYGNDYSSADMLTDLTAAIVEADRRGEVNTYRRNLQTWYTEKLISLAMPPTEGGTGLDSIARANVLSQILTIREVMEKGGVRDAGTRAHRLHLVYLIDSAFDRTRG
ncbi:MAG: zinc-dependent metalloprotease, partial [Pseudomonadota bacterium]